MLPFNNQLAIAALFFVCFIQSATCLLTPTLSSDTAQLHTLKAARRFLHNVRRSHNDWLTQSTSFRYIDESHNFQDSSIFSSVSVESTEPFLVLEEVEHHLKFASCSESTIRLYFTNSDSMNAAKESCLQLKGRRIITSHYGCNKEGARVVFIIDDIDIMEKDLMIKLGIRPTSWKESFQNINIEYGHTTERHDLRRHLQRRQFLSSTPTVLSTIDLPTVTIPLAPTSTGSSATINLDQSIINEPLSFPIDLDLSAPVSISCRLCKTTGKIRFAEAGFSINNLSSFDIQSPLDRVSFGAAQLDVTDFSAHVELDITPSLAGNVSFTLFSVPVFGIEIPEIGTAGILLETALGFGWQLSGGITLTYGFEIALPDEISLKLNMTNLGSSTVVGLDKPVLKTLPFQANISDIELSMQLDITPKFLVAFSFLDDSIYAEAGAFLNLPQTTIDIHQLATTEVDANCQSSNGTTPDEIDFRKAFQNLTHISPAAQIGFGFGLDVVGQALDVGARVGYATATTPLLTSFPLSTACLAFQKPTSGGAEFVPAATAFSSMKAAVASSKPEGKKGAGARINNPFEGLYHGTRSQSFTPLFPVFLVVNYLMLESLR